MTSSEASATINMLRIPELANLELLHVVNTQHSYSKHSHEEYSICLVHKGLTGGTYRGKSFWADTSSVVLMQPDEIHSCFASGNEALSYSMLYPTQTLMQSVNHQLNDKENTLPFNPTVVQDKTLSQLLKDFLAQCFSRTATQTLALETKYLKLLAYLQTRYCESKTKFRPLAKEHLAVTQSKHYIQEHYNKAISLNDLSNLTGLNASYLTRVFKKQLGIAPHTYQLSQRLIHAKRSLSQQQSIARVASELGFADQSHFARQFKRSFGLTPRQYKKVRNVQDF